MGYFIEQKCSSFHISADKIAGAVEALKRDIPVVDYAWVSRDWREHEFLDEIMIDWRWEVNENEQGNIDHIAFVGTKLGQDKVLFEALAPFVDDDSYIHMEGEDGTHWKWVFKGGKLKEYDGRVIFTDDDGNEV